MFLLSQQPQGNQTLVINYNLIVINYNLMKKKTVFAT